MGSFMGSWAHGFHDAPKPGPVPPVLLVPSAAVRIAQTDSYGGPHVLGDPLPAVGLLWLPNQLPKHIILCFRAPVIGPEQVMGARE